MSDLGHLDYRTAEPLLWLAGVGHEQRSTADYWFDASKRSDRPHCCLQLTLAGEGFYEDKQGRLSLPAGWAFFQTIPGDFSYGFNPQSPSPYELVFISMTGESALDWQRRLVQAFGPVLNLGESSAAAGFMLSLVRAWQGKSLADRYQVSARLYQLLMTLYSTLSQSRLRTIPRLSLAMQLIGEQATDASFGVSRLANQLDCSREHLSRLFQAALGLSPSEYLAQHRLRLAISALRDGQEKLERVARDCGFSSANYFVRQFRKRIGLTPAKFRKQPWTIGP